MLLISSGYIISMNPLSLMGRVPLFVPLRCFCYDLCLIHILVTQKLVLDSQGVGGGRVAGSTESSYLTLEPTVLMVGSVFLCIHFSFSFLTLPNSPQANRVPAAFAHREHGLQAHTVAALRLRRQRAGI